MLDDRLEAALATMPTEVAAEVRRFAEKAIRPLKPGDPRRHHYIPQFYLRRFATSAAKIAILRLDAPGEPTTTHVRNAGVVKDFYTTVNSDGADTNVAEAALGLLDSAMSQAIERLARGDALPPSPQDRLHISFWLGLQYGRDPQARRRHEAMADMFAKMHMPEVADEAKARRFLRDRHGVEPTNEEVSSLLDAVADLDWEAVPPQNELVGMMLEGAEHLAPYIWERRWSVIRFPTPGLATCDRPIVLYQYPENRSPMLGVGIATADEISFPLDRHSLLVLHSDDEIGDRALPAPPGSGVNDFNQMLANNTYSEIYCHPNDVARIQELTLPPADRPLARVVGGAWGDKPYPDGINTPPKRKKPRRYRQARNVDRE